MGDIGRAVGVLILGIIVISLVAAGVGVLIAGDADIEDDPAALTAVLLLSLPLELAFVGAAFAFSVRKYGVPWGRLGIKRPDRGGFLLAVGLFLGSLGMVTGYFGLLELAGVSPDADIPDEVFDNAGPVVAIAILSLLFAPVMEEVFFRGFIFGGLRKSWGLIGGALGSGLLFGVAHLGNPGTFYVVPPIALVGAFFAWGYAYSGSLYPSMGAHFLFNSFSLAIGLATS
jgi:membrane protease YdiL (CAAX protease family)